MTIEALKQAVREVEKELGSKPRYLNPDGTIRADALEPLVPTFRFALNSGLDQKFLPTQANDTDTGWDVRCARTEGVKLQPFGHVLIPLGFRIIAPPGWWLELRPRSSTHAKKHISCLYGVIDETYEGEVYLSCQFIPPPNLQSCELGIDFGEKIGQLVPVKRQTMNVESISNEEFGAIAAQRKATRGVGGFGSTG